MRTNLVSRSRSVVTMTAGISLALLASAAIAGGVAAADAAETQTGQLREHFLLEHPAEAIGPEVVETMAGQLRLHFLLEHAAEAIS